MKNILVTGASGFIGSFIVEEALKKGLSVWAGVRPTSSKAYLKQEELHFISFDFDDSDKLREQLLLFKQQEGGFDYIVHCAGVTKCVHQSDFDRGARHCTHAHALIDLEAARFHHALFEMPALKSSALAINIGIIHLAAANQAQALRQHLGR